MTPNKSFSFQLICLSVLLWLATPALSAELYKAKYEGEYSGWDITMTRTLEQLPGGNYQLQSKAKNLFATIIETSQFELTGQSITPEFYEYYRSVFGNKKTETLEFEQDKHQINYLKDKKSQFTHTQAAPGLTDPALFQLQLQYAFRLDAQTAAVHFAKRKKIKHYTFQRVGEGALTFEGKRRKAIVVEHKEDEKTTRVWLLPEFNYVIGKLEHKDEDDLYTLTLTEYQSNPAAVAKFYDSIELKSLEPGKP